MTTAPTPEEGQAALQAHCRFRAAEAREKYGGTIGFEEIKRILEDRAVVRYPTTLCFDARPLQPGEFAHAEPVNQFPANGFVLFVHPFFEERPEVLPALIAYHIPRINYGEIATHEEAEIFGAELLGMEIDAYYEGLCRLADSIPPEE